MADSIILYNSVVSVALKMVDFQRSELSKKRKGKIEKNFNFIF